MPTITKYSGKRGTTWQVRIRRHGKERSASFPTRKMTEEGSRKTNTNLIEIPTYLNANPPPTTA